MKTQAAFLSELNSPLVIDNVETPELRKGQVLTKILYSAICHSQLNEINGLKGDDKYLPHTLGHEASAIVEEIGPGVTKVRPGDYVVLTWIKASGLDCPSSTYKTQKGQINSGAISTFLKHAVISENRIVKISRDIPPNTAALFGCTVPTAAGIIKNNMNPKQGSSIAIFGAGGLGLSALLFTKHYQLNPVIVVDINDEKLKIASSFGATHVINAAKLNPINKIKELADNVDYAMESSGSLKAMEQAFSSIKDNGLVVIAGNPMAGTKISIDPFDLIKGKQIIGSWGGNASPDADIMFYAKLYLEGKFNIDKLISKTYEFKEINKAVKEFQQGSIVRALLKMSDD